MSFARPSFVDTRSEKQHVSPIFLGLPLMAVALLAAGCSDNPPPPPQAAWSISFVDVAPVGENCSTAGHNKMVGDVNDRERRTLIVDSVGGADIRCTVTGSSSFRVSDTVALFEAKSLSISIASITKNAREMSPVPGSILYSSEVTGGDGFQPPGDSPCNFYFTEGTPQGVGAGKIWVSFKCPELIGDGATQTCQISQGYAIFENCATE
jgi:hypothetical protein